MSRAACPCSRRRCSSCGGHATAVCSVFRITGPLGACVPAWRAWPKPPSCGCREASNASLGTCCCGSRTWARAPRNGRLVPLPEIEGIAGAERVLGALIDARLVTVDAGTVELSHEALLREWPRYRGWLEEDRVGRQLHAHLRVAAHEWKARGRDPGELYRGARLAAAIEFRSQHAGRTDRLEREFIAASQLEAERETGRQRAQNRRLRALLIGAGVLLVLTVVAGVVAVLGARRASSDARLALAEAHAALGTAAERGGSRRTKARRRRALGPGGGGTRPLAAVRRNAPFDPAAQPRRAGNVLAPDQLHTARRGESRRTHAGRVRHRRRQRAVL